MRAPLAALLIAALAVPVGGLARADEKPKKPKLKLRAHPRNNFSPATVKFFAELEGGDDVEEYYCPELEWEWGDGGRSVYEADCEPWEPGTQIERLFIETHTFKYSGNYRVRLRLMHSEDPFVAADVEVTVRPGAGDPGY